MEPSFEIDSITLKYIMGEPLSPEESDLLHDWLAAAEGRLELLESMKGDSAWLKADIARMQDINTEPIWSRIEHRLQQEGYWLPQRAIPTLTAISRPADRRWMTYVVAATVLLLFGASILLILNHRQHTPNPAAPLQPQITDIQPGGNKAILTLADGRRINLDSSANGVLAAQGNMKVSKLSAGQLTYHKSNGSTAKPEPLAYNSLSTPRAGQFTLTLPDGTRVWLNNASTLRYPVAFTGSARPVELTGEAYFEVARDAAHPFKVIVHKGEGASAPDKAGSIDVLGTSFNIMAYNDEPAARATLVEGSIKFNGPTSCATLHPGEQSVLDAHSAVTVLTDVNVEEVIAWKNGYFHFDHASLQTTMRQLARWYDIDVKFDGTPAEQEFVGRIQRDLPLSAVLKGLENEKVHFKLEGRALTVMP